MFPTSPRRASALAFAFALAAIGVAPARASAPAGTDRSTARSASVEAEHVALRDAIWRLERLLRTRLATNASPLRGSTKVAPGDPGTAELADLLDVLGRAGRKLGAEERSLARKARALAPLLDAVEVVETRGPSGAPSASPWQVDGSATRLDSGVGATCEGALEVGDGRYAAAIGTWPGASTREVWLRYTPARSGMAVVSTAGSDFDTVVDLFRACSAASTSLAHGDDEVGLQARAAAQATAGEALWVRVRGWDGATGTAAIALQGGAAGFAGAVTDETNGEPLEYRVVEVWNTTGFFVTSTDVDFDGGYVVAGLPPGTYYAATSWYYDPDGYLDELYDDKPCAGGPPQGCAATTGTPITVQDGVILNGIDFALGHGAAIAGRVRAAATALPLRDVDVDVYGPGGALLGSVETDEAGRFLVNGLPTGVVYAVAFGFGMGYRRELYQDISCGFGCNVTAGTPISVQEGHTTPGVDFNLERLGAIAGKVTRVADGSPVTYGEVQIFDAQGQLRSRSYTNAAGEYLAGGLDAGSYFARTDTYGTFFDELYDDLPCEPSCNLASGTPVAVVLDDTTAGIDFELKRMGAISGALTDATNGNPLTDYSYFYVYDGSGIYVTSAYTFGSTYEITGLPAGNYHVVASHSLYRNEVYDDVPCPWNCDPTVGTPVQVTLDANTSGIDFALSPLGKIAGAVVAAGTNAPLGGVNVWVWNAAGSFVAYAYSSAGTYEVAGLDAGTYYVVAFQWNYVGELYDNLPCGDGPPDCNPLAGTGVAVSLASTTSGINFSLARRGAIAGTVRDGSNAAPIPYPTIQVYDSTGSSIAWFTGNSNGTYLLDGLDAGTYYVTADSPDHDGELFDGFPCLNGSCNPLGGTAVPVSLGATTAGIDFDLPRSGTIEGVVTGGGHPLSYVYVYLYNASGNFRASTGTDGEGHYRFNVEPGTWFLLAIGSSEYAPQLYDGIPCPNGSCVVTTGTPVVATQGVATSGIDFDLAPSRGISGRVTDSAGNPLQGVALDLWSQNGTHLGAAISGPGGFYQLLPNSGGTYFVSTDSGMGALEEVWNNVPCPLGPAYAGGCNPTTGTPVTLLNSGSLASGIDFALDGVDLLVNGFEPGDEAWSAWRP